MLDLRQRIFIIIGLSAGLILALVLLIVSGRDKAAPGGEVVTVTSPAGDGLPSGAVREPAAAAVESGAGAPAVASDPDEIYTAQLARIFVERFGSYSNQNDNQHIADALTMASERMAAWLETQKIASGAEYAGVMTKVVASSITQREADRAEVAIDVQQVSEGAGASPVAYKSGRVELVKVGKEWKVDGLYWE